MRRIITLGATLALLAGAFVAPARASVNAAEICVTIYENGNGAGDSWQRCGSAGSLANASLVGDIVNLGGTPPCNSQWWPAAGNDWNDCVSAVRVDGGLTGRVVFYWGTNYGGRTYCLTTGSGFSPLGGADNDQFSSWRSYATGTC